VPCGRQVHLAGDHQDARSAVREFNGLYGLPDREVWVNIAH
jgi:hypothetical protein